MQRFITNQSNMQTKNVLNSSKCKYLFYHKLVSNQVMPDRNLPTDARNIQESKVFYIT